MTRQAVEHADMQGETAGKALRRRGILAAAGAAVAGMVAKQTAQPVMATSGGGDQGYLALGSNNYYKVSGDHSNVANVSSVATVLEASPNYQNYVFDAGGYVLRVDA